MGYMTNTDSIKQAMAILVKQPDHTCRLGDENDLTIGEKTILMLPNGDIVSSSPVQHYIKNTDGSLRIITKHSTYNIVCTNVRV